MKSFAISLAALVIIAMIAALGLNAVNMSSEGVYTAPVNVRL